MNKEKAKKVLKSVSEVAVPIGAALLFVLFLAQMVSINGQSMEPTFHDGDRVMIQKVNRNYRPGDIVVIKDVLDRPIIKRVIATGGQTVDIDETAHEIMVDGVIVPGANYNAPNNSTYLPDKEAAKFPVTIPEGYIFVLGDNREHSTDSRYEKIGPIPNEKVIGSVLFRVWPPH